MGSPWAHESAGCLGLTYVWDAHRIDDTTSIINKCQHMCTCVQLIDQGISLMQTLAGCMFNEEPLYIIAWNTYTTTTSAIKLHTLVHCHKPKVVA